MSDGVEVDLRWCIGMRVEKVTVRGREYEVHPTNDNAWLPLIIDLLNLNDPKIDEVFDKHQLHWEDVHGNVIMPQSLLQRLACLDGNKQESS